VTQEETLFSLFKWCYSAIYGGARVGWIS